MTLDFRKVSYYNADVQAGNRKDFDEDSRICANIQASRRWWKAGISSIYLKITSELQLQKGMAGRAKTIKG